MRRLADEPVWLGNVGDLRDERALHEAGIEAVVELAADEPMAELGRGFVRLRYPLVDNEGNDPARLRCCIRAVADLFRERIPTVVACSAGLSRTPAIVAAAWSLIRAILPDEALRELAASVPCDVSPALWAEIVAVTESMDGTVSN